MQVCYKYLAPPNRKPPDYSSADVVNFLNSTIRYMDTLDWIQGYAWFAYFVSFVFMTYPGLQ